MRTAVPLSLLVLLGGCGAGSVTLREPDAYEGCATDENWRSFDDRERSRQVTVSDAEAPAFLDPLHDGATLPAGARPTFAWRENAAIAGGPNGDALCKDRCADCGSLTAQHLPPVSGNLYDLQLAVGSTVVYRVITSLQRWTPSESAWAALRGKTLSLVAYRGRFKVNDLQEGPFQAARPIGFTVGN